MDKCTLQSIQGITSPCVRPLIVHQQGCFILRQALSDSQERTDVRLLFGIPLF